MLLVSGRHISTQAASIRSRCGALNCVRKNSSRVSCLRSWPNHKGSPVSERVGDELLVPGQQRVRLRDGRQFFQGFSSQPPRDLSQCRLVTFRKQESTLDLTSHRPPSAPKAFWIPLDLHPSESEIVDAVFQPEKPIQGEPGESCRIRDFNAFEFFDHTA